MKGYSDNEEMRKGEISPFRAVKLILHSALCILHFSGLAAVAVAGFGDALFHDAQGGIGGALDGGG